MSRAAISERSTRETDLEVEINLDDYNEPLVETGIPFFDHMLRQLGTHSGIALRVQGSGDLEIDSHHTVEDVGLTLGEALGKALGDRRGIRRYGSVTLPLDETLVRACLDISGRGYLDHTLPMEGDVEGFPLELLPEFFRGFARRGGLTLHLDPVKTGNRHHLAEATFKAVARVLRRGVARVGDDVPSTKGTLSE